jgi:hypothetical protein
LSSATRDVSPLAVVATSLVTSPTRACGISTSFATTRSTPNCTLTARDDTVRGMKSHVAVAILLVAHLALAQSPATQPTQDDGKLYLLTPTQLTAGAHHTRHAELFAQNLTGYNRLILRAIDKVQATAPDGGGYFIGIKAQPPESPIGYRLSLFTRPLLDPPRTTSYCSGSTYTAFIESLNLIFPDSAQRLSAERLEALRMQEPDGSRREDGVKFWGHWNDDGFGTHFALVQYSKMGEEIEPTRARPGDFANISWKSGHGHSVIFLGWHIDASNNKRILYWASQPGTNGLGDQMSSLDKIAQVKFVRLTHPENLFTFDPATKVNRKVPGDKLDW